MWNMRLFYAISVCLISLAWTLHSTTSTGNVGANGGVNCAACSLVIALVEQLMEIKNYSVQETLDELCGFLPDPFRMECAKAVEYMQPVLVELIISKNGPDVVCHTLRFCHTEPGYQTCNTIVPPFESKDLSFEQKVKKATQLVQHHLLKLQLPRRVLICDVPGINNICKWVERSFINREPLADFDKDGFSPSMSYRGTAWRGRDCSDVLPDIHPGAVPVNRDIFYDSNCNGIWGVNNVTKQPYEDELCAMTEPKGVLALGDSISAHFSLPPNWLDATKISKDAFKHLKMIVENEMDWPMLSSITGHGNNTWTEVIRGPLDSIYKRMVERNRCNHRDYQNIAQNGEQSFSIHKLMKTLSRNPTRDKPLLISFALVGNDICRGAHETLENMTTPEEMHRNTMITLEFLNQKAPVGSFVAVLGLADGRVLYEFMRHRVHPVGTFWQDFTYSQFYDYMNCLKISPCPAWMNTNETLRDMGAKRVFELNNALEELVKQNKDRFSNLKIVYFENPFRRAISRWLNTGGAGWQLVEPSDGFHSNQIGQALTAEISWEMVKELVPEAVGQVNPHNQRIQQLFGDQGGL